MTANAGLLDILLERLLGWGGARGVWKVGADAQSKATKKDIRGQSWEIGMGS